MKSHCSFYPLIIAIIACTSCFVSSTANAQDSSGSKQFAQTETIIASNDPPPRDGSGIRNDSEQKQKAKKNKYASGMPKNTRQVKEGYWIGALPGLGNADALFEHNIRLVITATRNTSELGPLNERLDELKISHLTVPFGSKFPHPSKFIDVVSKFSPNEIYIHCDHGGDRSGAIIAYLLVKKHNWTVPHALLAVLYPGKTDIRGLKSVLNERGYDFDDNDIEKYLGIYSATNNGGGGGLKVRSADYKKLIYTFLDSIEGKSTARKRSSKKNQFTA